MQLVTAKIASGPAAVYALREVTCSCEQAET